MVGNKISFNTIKNLNKNGESYRNISLSQLTTFKSGGIAKYFLKIKTIENFIKIMFYLKEKNYPYFVIGNGSNVLASDHGYDGIVIRLDGDFNRVLLNDNRMECGAGVLLGKAFVYARDNGLSGFEYGAGIPATIGGAVYMNAQAGEFEMAKLIDYVVAYKGDKIVYLKNTDCNFGYRDSVFQHGDYIILRVGLVLKKSNTEQIFNDYKETLVKRKQTQPYEYPNAGCIFKRQDGIIVSKMLDEMGVKNYNIGGASVSEKHANFIINSNHATSLDIWQLINKIKQDFFNKYNINLECEIKLLGEFNEINR